jgi:hypothetical protein
MYVDDYRRLYLEMCHYFPLPNSSLFNNYEYFHISFKVVKSLIWYDVVKYSKCRNKLTVPSQVTLFANRNIAKSGFSYCA